MEKIKINDVEYQVAEVCNVCGKPNTVITEEGDFVDIDCLCDKVEKAKNRQKIYKKYSANIVNPKNRLSSFVVSDKDDKIFKEQAIEFLNAFDSFIESPQIESGIIFSGKCGTGKTFICNCICNEMNDRGYTYLDINLSTFFDLIRDEPDGLSSRDILKMIAEVDLLFIDDVGAEMINRKNGAEWAEEKIYNLFDTRAKSEKPTLLTTNLTSELLQDHLKMYGSDRIFSRMHDIFGVGLRHNGVDKRIKKNKLKF